MAKDETPTKEITIQKHVFSVSEPYAEGHTCTEAEAKALNQTRHENIRNNMARKIKDVLGDAEQLTDEQYDEIALAVAEYDANYEFTLASVGGGAKKKDPIEVEATKIARAAIAAKLKADGRSVKSVTETEEGKAAYDNAVATLAASEGVMEQAATVVKARNAVAETALGDLDI